MIYPATEQYINLANNALINGKIIVYPTDTLYGFGVDATNTSAIKNLNIIKKAPMKGLFLLETVKNYLTIFIFLVAVKPSVVILTK